MRGVICRYSSTFLEPPAKSPVDAHGGTVAKLITIRKNIVNANKESLTIFTLELHAYYEVYCASATRNDTEAAALSEIRLRDNGCTQ